MQRRLEIAMGLLHRPQVLFLDEPTTGLDPEARVQMWREIERLAAEEQMTILLTTHYLEEADRLASMLAIVDRGKVVARGTPNELKSELHGDAIQVELADAGDSRASAALGRVAGLGEVTLDGRMIRARAQNGGAAIPAVLAALDAQGVTAMAVTLARPSLDDVYLRHAGRAFHQTDDTQEEAA
jgi:ABC-2 type transport system ATP-binding protein